MANSAEFRDLIYKSADPTAPINDNTKVDRLLGIKPNGEAVVVDIKGNNTVALKSDAPAIDIVKYTAGIIAIEDAGDTNDSSIYSCKAVNRLIKYRIPGIVSTALRWDDYKNDDDSVPSCATVQQLIGSGSGDIIVDDENSNGNSQDKTYSCRAINALINNAIPSQQQTTDGLWMQDGNYIKTIGNKNVSVGSATLKIGNASMSYSDGKLSVNSAVSTTGALSAASASITGAVSVGGNLSVSGNASLGTIQTQNRVDVASIRIGGWWNDSPYFTMKTEGGNGIAAYCSINLSVHAPSFYQSSDASLKDNVAPLSDSALSAAASVPLVEFDWKESGLHSYGTIAQECEKHMPELVSEGSDGKKSVDYIALLCAKVAALEKKVAELKSKVQ